MPSPDHKQLDFQYIGNEDYAQKYARAGRAERYESVVRGKSRTDVILVSAA